MASRSYIRIQLCLLFQYQDGLCCHCQEPMDLHFNHVEEQSGIIDINHATIEHTLPIGLRGKNMFCNYLAAHSDCNNLRSHDFPSDELIAYHMMIHKKILDGGDYPMNAVQPSLDQFSKQEYKFIHRDEETHHSPFAVLLQKS